MRRLVASSLLLAAAAASSVPAQADPGGIVVSVNSATYYPGGDGRPDPNVVLQGTELQFLQLDPTTTHSVTRYDGEPFDLDFGDPGFFDSGQQTFGSVVEVDTASLPAGTYRFFCTIHPNMRGEFQII